MSALIILASMGLLVLSSLNWSVPFVWVGFVIGIPTLVAGIAFLIADIKRARS